MDALCIVDEFRTAMSILWDHSNISSIKCIKTGLLFTLGSIYI